MGGRVGLRWLRRVEVTARLLPAKRIRICAHSTRDTRSTHLALAAAGRGHERDRPAVEPALLHHEQRAVALRAAGGRVPPVVEERLDERLGDDRLDRVGVRLLDHKPHVPAALVGALGERREPGALERPVGGHARGHDDGVGARQLLDGLEHPAVMMAMAGVARLWCGGGGA